MPRPDYYELLDVEPTVPQAELKLAYYRQAKRFHPDLNVGDAAAEERFKLIAEAYRILGDAQERRLYDEARERDLRYADAPELAGMQRRVRFSVRSARRREEKPRSLRRRFSILPERKKMPRWVIWCMGVLWVSALLPFVMRTGNVALNYGKHPEKKEKPEPAEMWCASGWPACRASWSRPPLRGMPALSCGWGFSCIPAVPGCR